MDKSWLSDLVVQLYLAVQSLGGYPPPAQMPEVQLMPREQLQQLVCKGPCSIRAFYHPDMGVIVDEAFNLKSNLHDQSILFHELVHHAQHVAGRFDNLASVCEARSNSEAEAYELQNRYLATMHATERIPVMRWALLCHQEGTPEERQPRPARIRTLTE